MWIRGLLKHLRTPCANGTGELILKQSLHCAAASAPLQKGGEVRGNATTALITVALPGSPKTHADSPQRSAFVRANPDPRVRTTPKDLGDLCAALELLKGHGKPKSKEPQGTAQPLQESGVTPCGLSAPAHPWGNRELHCAQCHLLMRTGTFQAFVNSTPTTSGLGMDQHRASTDRTHFWLPKVSLKGEVLTGR